MKDNRRFRTLEDGSFSAICKNEEVTLVSRGDHGMVEVTNGCSKDLFHFSELEIILIDEEIEVVEIISSKYGLVEVKMTLAEQERFENILNISASESTPDHAKRTLAKSFKKYGINPIFKTVSKKVATYNRGV